jgi:hypothetical protein
MKYHALAAVAALVSGFCGSAHSTLTIFTSQASFLSQIAEAGVDTFDDLSQVVVTSPRSRTAGAYGYTASVGPNSGFFPAGAGADIWLASDNRFDTIRLWSFPGAIRGVGAFFFGTDQNGALTAEPASIAVTATDTAGSISQVLINPTRTTYLGFVSDRTITSVELSVSGANGSAPNVWPTVNDLALGVSPVPEPDTAAMMLIGLALLGTAVRKRAQRA